MLTGGLILGGFIGAQMKLVEESGNCVEYGNGSIKITKDSMEINPFDSYSYKVFEIEKEAVNIFNYIKITKII